MNQKRLLAILLYLTVCCVRVAAGSNWTASKILYNGKIFTADQEMSFVQALAIRGRFIIKSGSDEDVMALQRYDTQMIDLQGRTVIPGINDAHIHLAPFNANGIYLNDPNEFIPGPGPTLEEFLEIIAGANLQVPPGVWFYLVVGESVLDDPNCTRFTLDAVAPDRPVLMLGWSGHQSHINTAAMEAVGISETEPDPFGGYYERVEGTDIINGVLQEYAIYDLLRRIRAQLPTNLVADQLSVIGQQLVQRGMTSVQDMGIGFTADQYEDILETANLPLRVRNIPFPLDMEESRSLYRDSVCPINPLKKVVTSGVKWVADGTPLERGAALEAPYFDAPGWAGISNFSLTDFNTMIADTLDSWYLRKEQRLIHASGDKTVTEILRAMHLAGPDFAWKFRRFRIEHGDMIQPEHIPDLAAKGVVVVQNPTHLALPEVMFRRVGPERFSVLQPMRSLLDAGVPLALGSDSLGSVPNPYLEMMLATLHPTNPSEAITLPEAVVAYTRGSAHAEFMDHLKGTLKAGQLADLAVLSQDIFNPTNGPTLPATYSVLTLVDGEIVWNDFLMEVPE